MSNVWLENVSEIRMAPRQKNVKHCPKSVAQSEYSSQNLGGGFLAKNTPYLGKIPILAHIFQLGGVWLNLPAWSPVPAERAVCYLGKCHGGRSTV